MMRLVPYAVLIMVLSVSTLSQAQHIDPRDYEATYFAKSNMLQIQGYARHISSSDKSSVSQSQGLLRATYVLKFGNLLIAPVNLILPFVDLTAYSVGTVKGATPLPNTDGTPGVVTTSATTVTHLSGLGDLRYFATFAYNIAEDPMTATHTTIALCPWVVFPTGSYDDTKYLNIGENRLTIIPQLILGQRLIKVLTVEAYVTPVFRTDNKNYLIPQSATLPATYTTLVQDMSWMAGAIVGVDLSKVASVALGYSLDIVGKRTVQIPLPTGGITESMAADSQTIHTLRFTVGTNLGETSHLLFQVSEDFAGSDTANLGRYVGMRFTQRFFFSD